MAKATLQEKLADAIRRAAVRNPQHAELWAEAILGSFGDRQPRWLAVARLPLSAVFTALTSRDSFMEVTTPDGFGAVNCGGTISGRNLFGAVESQHNDSFNPQWRCGEERPDITPITGHGLDTWLVIEMEKDPRKSAFATDVEVFGDVAWFVVNEGVSPSDPLNVEENVGLAIEAAIDMARR